MVGHRLAAILVLVPVLANIEGTIGLAAASTTGIVTRGDQTVVLGARCLSCISESSHGVTETIHPLPNKERARVRAGKRGNVDLTRENCASTCGGVAGSGPNQADCNQIIDALKAQNTATFTVGPYSVAKWVQASCTIEFVQSTADTVTYTYLYLGSVASHLSDACNAENGYADGRCIFDGREDAIWIGNTADSSQSM